MSRIKRLPAAADLPLSRAVLAGGFCFLSGQIPLDANGNVVRGDIAAQTEAVLDRISETLAKAGCRMSDVVRATVWLSDLGLFGEFNKVYAARFGPALPARSTVQARLSRDVDIEIEVQALLPERRIPGPGSEA
ncbi:RidA family protein [Bordetella genomosp. 7]|uniref:Enamine deaminase RidA n=1 Tax=Bordetella genomosp. 7 TaxID=1416805 RepID=A0A261QWV9_9BORD|nr:RidA family protein [Bordetella genomosp. 7]OZI17265.1 enamine deaminase RidA [Bordetella genomosp. 7]